MRKLCFASAFLFVLCTFLSTPILANNAPSYIEKHKDIAIREMFRSGIPASITIAQAIHESGWGSGTLATESNNYFGIKCKDYWTGPTYYIKDDDLDKNGKLIKSCFRAYEKIEDSFVDHSDFLRDNPRYNVLFQLDPTDYRGWAKGLQKCGYATDVKYAEKLIANIEKYQLYQYDTAPQTFAPAPQIAITKPQSKPNASAAAAPRFNLGSYVSANPAASAVPEVSEAAPVITEAPAEAIVSAPVMDFSYEEENYDIPEAVEIPEDYSRGENRTEVKILGINISEPVVETEVPVQVAPSIPTPTVKEDVPTYEAPLEVVQEEELPEEVEQYYVAPVPPAPAPVQSPAPVKPNPIKTESEAIIKMTYTENRSTTQLSRQPRVANSGRRR